MRFTSIRVCGFRAYGAEEQLLECDGPLTVIYGANSRGKSSLVEAIEFLLTGRTTRVQLHGGSASEFAECLRNVYLPAEALVYVEAGVEVGSGRHVVRRTLDEDLTPSGACKSTLTVDCAPADSLTGIGILLSPPPFESPVLMQHALRFVLSAKPQRRADYLKAVLDISDLDDVRAIIRSELAALVAPTTPSLERLLACQSHPAFGHLLAGADPTSCASIAGYLAVVFRHLLGLPDGQGELPDLVEALEVELRRRQQAVFPIADVRPSTLRGPGRPELPAVHDLSGRESIEIADETPAILQLLAAVLTVPHLSDLGHAVDCPVCLTPKALTPERIDDIAEHLRSRAATRKIMSAVQRELAAVEAYRERLSRALAGNLIPASGWTVQQQAHYTQDAEGLLPGEGRRALASLISLAQEVDMSQRALLSSVSQLPALVREGRAQFERDGTIDVVPLDEALDRVDQDRTTLEARLDHYATTASTTVEQLEAVLSTKTRTEGWRQLLEVAETYTQVPPESRMRAAHEALVKEGRTAERAVEKARTTLLDSNFDALSDDIGEWWQLLRPDEPIRFSRLQRRGAGVRHVDLTALLAPKPTGTGAERHASGVFSDSQLNALGLSIFLARAMRGGMGIVVLDDPVPASDDEHRGQFARSVIEELIRRNVQVLLATHDKNLKKRVHDLHSHVGIDGYEVRMDDPGDGASLIRHTDDLSSLLDEAQESVKHCLDSQLGDASNKVRRAAERLCKEVVVRARREDGENITTADIQESLGELAAMAAPHLTKDPSHPGKLRHTATVTNPGSHDDPNVASRQDLVGVMGDLRKLRKDYCR